MSFTEFAETFSDQERIGLAYEGVTIEGLYEEYLASIQEPDDNSRPLWAYFGE